MKTRRIGELQVSVVGLGANNFGTDFFGNKCDEEEAARIIHGALDAGVTLIDTAEEYSTKSPWGVGRSEQFIGAAVRSRRDEVTIVSKFSVRSEDDPTERGATRVVRAVEGSLQRLGTDRIDLYQQHFPEPDVPFEEMLEALDGLVRDGKVREIGCCNFSGEMLDAALAVSANRGLARFVSTQNQYNLLDPPAQEGVLEACRDHGLMMLPFYPLASGLLTGKYRKDQAPPTGSRFGSGTVVGERLKNRQFSEKRVDTVEQLEAFARERGHTILELAVSWLASQPFVASVIAGATRPEQIRSNAEAACWDLTPEDFAAVAAIVE